MEKAVVQYVLRQYVSNFDTSKLRCDDSGAIQKLDQFINQQMQNPNISAEEVEHTLVTELCVPPPTPPTPPTTAYTGPTSDCYKGDRTHYTGKVGVTESGRLCQAWASNSPHDHHAYNIRPEEFPDGFLPSNYCRSPPADPESRPWCYTTDPGVRWEHCDVHECPRVKKHWEIEIVVSSRGYAGSDSSAYMYFIGSDGTQTADIQYRPGQGFWRRDSYKFSKTLDDVG